MCDLNESLSRPTAGDRRRAHAEWRGAGRCHWLRRSAPWRTGQRVPQRSHLKRPRSRLPTSPVRAIGTARVEALIDSQGDLGSFRSLQRQPEWRSQPTGTQLRRFLGSGARRKLRYARLLAGRWIRTGSRTRSKRCSPAHNPPCNGDLRCCGRERCPMTCRRQGCTRWIRCSRWTAPAWWPTPMFCVS
jgi:hypothetical protein